MEVGSYRKKGEEPRRNKDGVKLFEPTSRQVLYDKVSKTWIPHRKRVYLIWFKYLQHCERDKTRNVDWTKYSGWGSRNEILESKFDEWWNSNWRDLFGVKTRGDTPKFPTQGKLSSYEPLRTGLLVYEYGLKYPKLTSVKLSQKILKRESQKRYVIYGFELPDVSGDDEFIYPYESINSKVSIFRKKTRQTMDNVCIGKFP